MINHKKYMGTSLTKGVTITSSNVVEVIPPYFPNEDIIQAVEYARLLQRPLLLKGDPGSGKTRLAQAVAYELYGENYRTNYYEWYIKSQSKASEGLYRFDHIKRLRDAQFNKDSNIDLSNFCELGPMGKAFQNSTSEEPCILLIDEIDKADIDFPNDLLLELDQRRFQIPETGQEIISKASPIVFITSNDEKELPNAFLRRCIFCYVDAPNNEQLVKIVNAHLKNFIGNQNNILDEGFVLKVIHRYRELLKQMARTQSDKKPSTSELIDWGKLIQFYCNQDLGYKENLGEELESGQLPYAEILLKTLDDYKLYRSPTTDAVK